MFNKASDALSDYYYFQADVKGNSTVPDMSGTVRFYPWLDGTMVEMELTGLPTREAPFAVHIHEGAVCEPNEFKSAGPHLVSTDVELTVSPENHAANIKSSQKHPGHMGDLPSIFSNNGYAYMATYTDRFIPQQVNGRTVIIHSSPDSFTDTSSFGTRIACGVIHGMEVSRSR
ncbi:MAG: superoxide dismutase family protein [Acutalibacteraceae bacterium]